jgi:tRNA(Ser,Leu) C12 N-acetylase TAN1
MVDANLIVSYDPCHIDSAKEEIEKIFKDIKKDFKFLKSDIDGLFKLRVKEPKKLIRDISKIAKKDISKFEKTFHWTPIDKWCKSTVKDMQNEIKKLVIDIKKTDKWKMDLNKRKYDKEGTTELILKLTEVVDRPKVDLKNPKKVIKVEIIGNKAGLALLEADELFNATKFKKK